MVVTYHFTTQLSIHRLQLFKIFIFSEDRHQTAANRPAGRAYAAGKTGVSILHGHKAETATYSASDIKRHYMLRLLCLKCALMHYNCPLSAWSPSAMKIYGQSQKRDTAHSDAPKRSRQNHLLRLFIRTPAGDGFTPALLYWILIQHFE